MRNAQQKEKILGADFPGWTLDEHLVRLDGPQCDPSYTDPRHCLVFWARPAAKLRNLIGVIQEKLTGPAPGEHGLTAIESSLILAQTYGSCPWKIST